MFLFALLVVVVLGAVAFARRGSSPAGLANQPRQSIAPIIPAATTLLGAAPATTSFRQQQLDEEAEAVATVYRDRANEVWRTELKAKASQLFADQP